MKHSKQKPNYSMGIQKERKKKVKVWVGKRSYQNDNKLKFPRMEGHASRLEGVITSKTGHILMNFLNTEYGFF